MNEEATFVDSSAQHAKIAEGDEGNVEYVQQPEENWEGGYVGEDGLTYFQGEDGYWYAYESNEVQGNENLMTQEEGQETAQPTVETPEQRIENVVVPPIDKAPSEEPPRSSNKSLPALNRLESIEYNQDPSDEPENLLLVDGFAKRPSFFVRLAIYLFFSTAFRIYFTILIYCAGMLLTILNIEISMALLLRLFGPIHGKTLEPFLYLGIFFSYSFFSVTTIDVVLDMVTNLWTQKRGDKIFWGIRIPSKKEKLNPPVFLYLTLIILVTIFPFLWACIEAGIKRESILFLVQRFFNVTILTVVVLTGVCYISFYSRAMYFKARAMDKRKIRDDFVLRDIAYRKFPTKRHKTHWYHAATVLEEFGLDRKTLLYNVVVFIIGLGPLFGIFTAQVLSTFIGDPSVLWGLIASIGISLMIIISWVSRLRYYGQWSAYLTAFLIVVNFGLTLASAGISGNLRTLLFAIVLFALTQGMLTRKRSHRLSKNDIARLLPHEGIKPEDASKAAASYFYDYYLCCCDPEFRDLCLPCLSGKIRPKRDPRVVECEKVYARKKVALRTDHRHLMVWWLCLMGVAAFLVNFGNTCQYNFKEKIAFSSGSEVEGKDLQNPLCRLSFNSESDTPFSLLDLAFLGALSYSYGTDGDIDFVTWFGSRSQFLRVYPQLLPPNRQYATDGLEIQFSHYVDFGNYFHIITLNSNFRGLGMFRYMDFWSSSVCFRVASSIAPLISIWPERYKASFMKFTSSLKSWLGEYRNLDSVTAYIKALIDSGYSDKILVVGDQFNGGYAKVLSKTLNVSYVSFNAPGVKYVLSHFSGNSIQILSSRNLWSLIDSNDDTGSTYTFPCQQNISFLQCSDIFNVISYLRENCGDPLGRYATYEH